METINLLTGEVFAIRQTQTGTKLQMLAFYYPLFQENQSAKQANTQSKGWKQKLLLKVRINTNSESLKWVTGTDGKHGDWEIVWDFVWDQQVKRKSGEKKRSIYVLLKGNEAEQVERQVVLSLLITDALSVSFLVEWK